MAMRAGLGIAGAAVASVAAVVGVVRSGADPVYEAKVLVTTASPDRNRLLAGPELRELVRQRLGETPVLRFSSGGDGFVLLQSRGITPDAALRATKTYAVSYTDVWRAQHRLEIEAAIRTTQARLDELQSEIDRTPLPARAALVATQSQVRQQADVLQVDLALQRGPEIVSSRSATPVDDGSARAWMVSGLGATIAAGAVLTRRRPV